MGTKQQQGRYAGATIDDVDAITQALELYIDGSGEGDAAKLAEAFHADAQMYGAIGGERYDVPITEYFDLAAGCPADAAGNYGARITSIVQIADAASATVVEEGFWGTMSFVDFFALCRVDGRWRIVNKTFTHTGGEPPTPR